jgi:hypothetical protein
MVNDGHGVGTVWKAFENQAKHAQYYYRSTQSTEEMCMSSCKAALEPEF